MKEYKIDFWDKFINGIFGTVALAVAILFLFKGIEDENTFFNLVALVFFAVGSLILFVMFRNRIIIDENSFTHIGLISTKTIALNAIKGYRKEGKSLVIESIQKSDPIININNFDCYENKEEILDWIVKTYLELNSFEKESELQFFLKDPTLGNTEDERNEKLKTFREIAMTFNIFGAGVGFIMIFVQHQISYLVLLLIPIVGVVVLSFFKLIKFISNPSKSVLGFTIFGFYISSLALIFKTAGIKMYNYKPLLVPIVFVFCSMFFFLYTKGINKKMRSIKGQVLAMAIVAVLYAFGSVKMTNYYFDYAKPQFFFAIIKDKNVSYYKKTSYFIKLSSWGPVKKEEQESVSKKFFLNTSIGDKVKIIYHKGFLNASWFEIDYDSNL